MQKADFTTRATADFVDLLLVLGLGRLPDVIGVMAATGYLLIRDGLFDRQSVGKKLIGLRVASTDDEGRTPGFRESILRNTTAAAAWLLFLVPYAGWVLGPLVLVVEALTALGDERGMRVGDLIARTRTVQAPAWGAATAAPSTMEGQPDFGAPPEPNNMKSND